MTDTLILATEVRGYLSRVSKEHHSRKRRQCDWWCAACGGQYDWCEAHRVLTIQASCRLEDTLGVQSARSASGNLRQHDQRLEALGELAEGRELY